MSDLEANAETLSLDYIKLDQLTDDTQCYQVENG